MGDEITQLSDYVPKRKFAYLDKHFRSWMMGVPHLRPLCKELEKSGAVCLGDVIQMSEKEILSLPTATPKRLEVLKADLATIGFKLGMRLPVSAPFPRRQSERQR